MSKTSQDAVQAALTEYNEVAMDMNPAQLTTAILDLEALESGKTPQQKQQIEKLVAELESNRANGFEGGEFPLGPKSHLHEMLLEVKPDKFAAMLIEENKGAAEASAGVHVHSHELLTMTPKELWPTIAEVGKELEKQSGGKSSDAQSMIYQASQFTEAMNKLSGREVSNRQLSAVLEEVPSALVTQEVKGMKRTLETHANSGKSSGEISATRKIEQGMGR